MMRCLAIAAIGLLACGCASAEHRYAGSPGSVYDGTQSPPNAFPVSDYDLAAQKLLQEQIAARQEAAR
jgi:hypothetical protein